MSIEITLMQLRLGLLLFIFLLGRQVKRSIYDLSKGYFFQKLENENLFLRSTIKVSLSSGYADSFSEPAIVQNVSNYWEIPKVFDPSPVSNDENIFADSFSDGEKNVYQGKVERKRFAREASESRAGALNDYLRTCQWTFFMVKNKKVTIHSAFFGQPDRQYPAGVDCNWVFIGNADCIPQVVCPTIDLRKVETTDNDGSAEKTCEDSLNIFDAWKGAISLCGEASFTTPKVSAGELQNIFIGMKAGPNTTFGRHYKGIECTVSCLKANAGPKPEPLPNFTQELFKTNQDCRCGVKPDSRIVGGNEAVPFEFPWIAALVYKGSRSPFCGATLINNQYVVTAGHCFDKRRKPSEYRGVEVLIHAHRMRVSSTDDKDEKSIRMSIDTVFVHPFYVPDPRFDYDVTVLKLSSPVDILSHTPICLIPPGASIEPGQIVTAAGWGKLVESGKYANALQKLDMPVIHSEKCGNFEYALTERMLCAGYLSGGKDACQGDSGGPLTKKNLNDVTELVGITSWGRGCARANVGGVYTKVSAMTQWIRLKSMDGIWCKQ